MLLHFLLILHNSNSGTQFKLNQFDFADIHRKHFHNRLNSFCRDEIEIRLIKILEKHQLHVKKLFLFFDEFQRK